MSYENKTRHLWVTNTKPWLMSSPYVVCDRHLVPCNLYAQWIEIVIVYNDGIVCQAYSGMYACGSM